MVFLGAAFDGSAYNCKISSSSHDLIDVSKDLYGFRIIRTI